MAYGDKDTFVPRAVSFERYADGTEVPHLAIRVFRNGVYRGYVEVHAHRVSDDSISIGVTSRLETEHRP